MRGKYHIQSNKYCLKKVLDNLQLGLQSILKDPNRNDFIVSCLASKAILDNVELERYKNNDNRFFQSEGKRISELILAFREKPENIIVQFLDILIDIPGCPQASNQILCFLKDEFPGIILDLENLSDQYSQDLQAKPAIINTINIDSDCYIKIKPETIINEVTHAPIIHSYSTTRETKLNSKKSDNCDVIQIDDSEVKQPFIKSTDVDNLVQREAKKAWFKKTENYVICCLLVVIFILLVVISVSLFYNFKGYTKQSSDAGLLNSENFTNAHSGSAGFIKNNEGSVFINISDPENGYTNKYPPMKNYTTPENGLLNTRNIQYVDTTDKNTSDADLVPVFHTTTRANITPAPKPNENKVHEVTENGNFIYGFIPGSQNFTDSKK